MIRKNPQNCPPLDFDQWLPPFGKMQLWGGRIAEIAHISNVPTLRVLTLAGHKHLQLLTGNNSGPTWMLFQDCKKLDVRSIGTFEDVEHLTITGIKTGGSLSSFSALSKLQTLSLLQCRMIPETVDLKEYAPLLKKIMISDSPESILRSVSMKNKNVIAANGKIAYVDGIACSDIV